MTHKEASGPPPSQLRILEFFEDGGELRGARGKIEDAAHPLDGWFASFATRHLGEFDFDSRIPHCNIAIGRELDPTATSGVRGQGAIAGFAKVGKREIGPTAQTGHNPVTAQGVPVRPKIQADAWKRLPPPEKKEPLGFHAHYTDAEAEQIMLGLRPVQMEDKWFIYYADGWLYCHRSWTGACIFAVRLDGSAAGVRVVDSWVNRDPGQYTGADIEYDRKLVRFLIDAFLLQKPATFPMPAKAEFHPIGVVQHHAVGRSYPESKAERKGAWASFARRIKRIFRR